MFARPAIWWTLTSLMSNYVFILPMFLRAWRLSVCGKRHYSFFRCWFFHSLRWFMAKSAFGGGLFLFTFLPRWQNAAIFSHLLKYYAYAACVCVWVGWGWWWVWGGGGGGVGEITARGGGIGGGIMTNCTRAARELEKTNAIGKHAKSTKGVKKKRGK